MAIKIFDIKEVIERETGTSFRKNKLPVCPFCGSGGKSNKTPAFTLFPKTNSFYCFACGAGTNPVSFIAKLHRINYQEAYKYLNQNFYEKFHN
jgi:DNA primase